MLQVHIVDKGIGIREADAKKLFNIFGVLPGSQDQNLEGCGIGLIICKKIVEHYNGTISCFSAGLDQGSTFIFSIKMHLQSEDDVAVPQRLQVQRTVKAENSLAQDDQ